MLNIKVMGLIWKDNTSDGMNTLNRLQVTVYAKCINANVMASSENEKVIWSKSIQKILQKQWKPWKERARQTKTDRQNQVLKEPVPQHNLTRFCLIIFMHLKKDNLQRKKRTKTVQEFMISKQQALFVWILVNGLLQDSTVKWMWTIILLHCCKWDLTSQQNSKTSLQIYHKSTSFQCILLYTLWMTYCLKAVFCILPVLLQLLVNVNMHRCLWLYCFF